MFALSSAKQARLHKTMKGEWNGSFTPLCRVVTGLPPHRAATKQSAARIQQYIDQEPYFDVANELEMERAGLVAATSDLREQVNKLAQEAEMLELERHNVATYVCCARLAVALPVPSCTLLHCRAGKIVHMWKGASAFRTQSKKFNRAILNRLNDVQSHIMRSPSSHSSSKRSLWSNPSATKSNAWNNVQQGVMAEARTRHVLASLSDKQRRRISLEYMRSLDPTNRDRFIKTLLELVRAAGGGGSETTGLTMRHRCSVHRSISLWPSTCLKCCCPCRKLWSCLDTCWRIVPAFLKTTFSTWLQHRFVVATWEIFRVLAPRC